MGSADKIDENSLSEWSKQSHALAEWATLFKLSEMIDSGCASKTDLEELNDFAIKAVDHKTPKKTYH